MPAAPPSSAAVQVCLSLFSLCLYSHSRLSPLPATGIRGCRRRSPCTAAPTRSSMCCLPSRTPASQRHGGGRGRPRLSALVPSSLFCCVAPPSPCPPCRLATPALEKQGRKGARGDEGDNDGGEDAAKPYQRPTPRLRQGESNHMVPTVKILGLKVRFIHNDVKLQPAFFRFFPNVERLHIEEEGFSATIRGSGWNWLQM